MKAKDLMLGDWVNLKCGDFPAKDTCLGLAELHDIVLNEIRGNEIPQAIEPIPLTDEILEKNGFKRAERTLDCDEYEQLYEIKAYDLYIGYGESEIGTNLLSYYCDLEDGAQYNEVASLTYVHQLQHALKLCGIDKQITL